MNMRHAAQIVLGIAIGPLACTGKYIRPTTSTKVQATAERIEHGAYLVNSIAACGTCHTPRVGGSWLNGERTDAYLAGGAVFDQPKQAFRISIPNITPDVETGIGAWSDDEIMRALRDGIHRDKNRLMYPPMPYYMYDRMSDEDAQAITAYLRSVPPVKNKVERVAKLPFMFRVMLKMGVLHHKPSQNIKAPPRTYPKAYGHYLARIGLCTDCHSMTSMGPDEEDNLLGGMEDLDELPEVGKIGFMNLTPDKETGIGRYKKEEIIAALRSGKRLDGKIMAPPMSWLIPHLSTWTDADLDALVTFIQSVPAIKRKVPERDLVPAAKKLVGE